MPEEGGCEVFMNWNARQSYRVKIITTFIMLCLVILQHWIFIDFPVEWHGMMIFLGILGIGTHAWFIGSLINTIAHDGTPKRRIIVGFSERRAYQEYVHAQAMAGEKYLGEEEWAKKQGYRTIQV